MRKLAMLAGLLLSAFVHAQGPTVAVTDLSYEEKVQEYFRSVSASSSHNTAIGGGHASHASSAQYDEVEMTYSYIERGELRKFTADIKGEMLKSGSYRVSQGRPYTAANKEELYDIIGRIKRGDYPGADYVLFGTVSSVDFRKEINPIPGASALSHTLSVELAADFSLIDTRTYEIKAAFSAIGEGQDARLTGARGGLVVPSRSRAVLEVSKSLGSDVARQLEVQFNPTGQGAATRGAMGGLPPAAPQGEETVTVLR